MNSLKNFLTEIADEIRRIKNKTTPIVANDFVTELSEIGNDNSNENEGYFYDNGMGFQINKNMIFSGLHDTPDPRIKAQFIKFENTGNNPTDYTLRFYNLSDEEIKGDEHIYEDMVSYYTPLIVKFYLENGELFSKDYLGYEIIPANGYYDSIMAQGNNLIPYVYSYEVVEYDE